MSKRVWKPVENGFVYTFDTGMSMSPELFIAAIDHGDDQAHLSVGRTNIAHEVCYLPDDLRLCQLTDDTDDGAGVLPPATVEALKLVLDCAEAHYLHPDYGGMAYPKEFELVRKLLADLQAAVGAAAQEQSNG